MTDQVNKAEQAYGVLEDMITFQDLAPGDVVSEVGLMSLTGFGRTPVREALQRLARERMVEIHPHRGAFVAAVSVEAHFQLLELRRGLEEMATRFAVYRAKPQQKEQMLALATALDEFEGTDVRQFGVLLKQAHSLVVEATQNEYLELAMAPLQSLSRRFWFAHLPDVAKELRSAADLHGNLLRAIAHGDEAAAAAGTLKLNDYLTDITYTALRGPGSHG
ncbi:GntR family transcriptional regulator [Amycolatopsis jiangsuensis]|uniref:DNA-binding GntR family transcriptional regulator n=1 Tax=Amycolatopsis jiangsuensis TaxID=1181879 RepID=A0A840J0Q2_9PSEU|nr:GntR family transcriptional regulator [Amycolatopsis jiangsuensis]MBB4686764.1 DNA-binding GntR family transcriptional regulator [Amycolatopsis jiangsuensis]